MFACTYRVGGSCINLNLYRRVSFQYCVNMKQHTWIVLLLVGFPLSLGGPRQLKLVNDWKTIDFNFPTQLHRDMAIAQGEFVSGMAVPIDVDVHYIRRG